MYWGFVTAEELERCRASSGFHCPHWGQDGCRSSKRFGDPNALVQHLQTKHSFDWKDAVWTARTAFGLFGQMKDERKPAEPASPPRSRTATKSAARKRPKEDTGLRAKEDTGLRAKSEPDAEAPPPLPPLAEPPAEPSAASSSSALPAELALLQGLFNSVAGRVLGPERRS